MPSNDETVIKRDVVFLLRRIKRAGWRDSFDRFADEEPVLAGYALAASDLLAIRLADAGVPKSVLTLIETEMMTAQLVCIESMRLASRQLWQDFLPDESKETE